MGEYIMGIDRAKGSDITMVAVLDGKQVLYVGTLEECPQWMQDKVKTAYYDPADWED